MKGKGAGGSAGGEGCGRIQKVGVGGGSHHVGAVGKNRPLETEVTVDHRLSFAVAELQFRGIRIQTEGLVNT